MANNTFYRKANVSSSEATASLFKRFPNAELVSFEHRAATAEEAASAGVKEGELVYAATVRTAEFPPAGDGGDEAPEAPKDSAPADGPPAPDSDGGEDKPDAPDEKKDDDDSDSDSDDGADPFGGGEGDDKGAKPKELKGEELTNHLLKQILDALKGGGAPLGPGGPDGPGGPGDLDLPDIGAPDKGEALSPPGPGGPGGPAGAKPPLPPPVKEKSPLGAGAFAHVASAAEITMVRSDAGEVNNKGILAEAAEYAPTHRVARIQRTGTAVVNGAPINVAERGIAVVTLVKK